MGKTVSDSRSSKPSKKRKTLKDGTNEVCIEIPEENVERVSEETEDGELFVLIEASKLSMDDELMQHEPNSREEIWLKRRLKVAIMSGVADFWRPRMDPTLDEEGNICFKAGKKPVVDKGYNWWSVNAKKYCPERHSKLGTWKQYIAFIGVLIKTLIAEGWTMDEAWNAVCNDSNKLGHYWDDEHPQDTKRGFEPTGSRAVAGFFDLANTHKILEKTEDYGGVYWLASGCYVYDSYGKPIASLSRDDDFERPNEYAVGWIVLS